MLVGTASVAKSERLASLLLRKGIPHEVLNAKQHAREAAIIANAGRKGAVTVATNMAGRGTDIMLGGNPEFAADLALRERGLTPDETPEEYEAAWPDALEKAKADIAKEHDEVVELGGLYVLGTERHESRRIDNQLRGRSGRQGDPGESRFYLSLGDDLMVRFNGERVAAMMNLLRLPEDVPIEAKMVSKAIQSAQTQVEQQNFEIRKNVLKYDEVMNKQRTVIYDERRQVLDGRRPVRADPADDRRRRHQLRRGRDRLGLRRGVGPRPALDGAQDAVPGLADASRRRSSRPAATKADLTREFLVEELVADAQAAYDAREEDLGAEVLRELERRVLLSVLDRKWREHLYEMDYLQEGIGLRAMAQRDPLVEYQREGFDMFAAMMERSRRSRSASCSTSRSRWTRRPTASHGRRSVAAVRPTRARRSAAADDDGADRRRRAAAAGPVAAQGGAGASTTTGDERQRRRCKAKGLDRTGGEKPLTYSAPELGSDAPAVQTSGGADKSAAGSATAKRQQARSNPNRGSRGNKGSSNKNKRKR